MKECTCGIVCPDLSFSVLRKCSFNILGVLNSFFISIELILIFLKIALFQHFWRKKIHRLAKGPYPGISKWCAKWRHDKIHWSYFKNWIRREAKAVDRVIINGTALVVPDVGQFIGNGVKGLPDTWNDREQSIFNINKVDSLQRVSVMISFFVNYSLAHLSKMLNWRMHSTI